MWLHSKNGRVGKFDFWMYVTSTVSNAFHSISKGDRKENAFYSFNATVDLLMQGLPVTHQLNIEFVS